MKESRSRGPRREEREAIAGGEGRRGSLKPWGCCSVKVPHKLCPAAKLVLVLA